MIEVTVVGAEQLARKMAAVDFDKIWDKVTVPEMETHRTQVGKYPALSALTYKRTGNLGKKWYVGTPRDLVTIVGNLAPYAKWVHGEDTQTKWSAAYRWKRINEGLDARIKKIMQLLGGAVKRALT